LLDVCGTLGVCFRHQPLFVWMVQKKSFFSLPGFVEKVSVFNNLSTFGEN
jgi:hypothetical protein